MICIDSHPRANPSLDRALGIGATCAVVAVLAYMDENVAFSFISIAGMDSWYGFALGALFGAFSVLFASFLVVIASFWQEYVLFCLRISLFY